MLFLAFIFLRDIFFMRCYAFFFDTLFHCAVYMMPCHVADIYAMMLMLRAMLIDT